MAKCGTSVANRGAGECGSVRGAVKGKRMTSGQTKRETVALHGLLFRREPGGHEARM